MRGRKPKPAALHILNGTDRGKFANAPMPEIAIPPCPEHLDGEARTEWNRVAVELHGMGLLTSIDRAVLAAYCQTWARWVEAEAKVTELGAVIQSPNGFPQVNPYLSVANEALRQMRAFAVELGLSPSSRSRVSVANKPKAAGVSKRNRA